MNALGFSVHTGWAVLVVLGDGPRLLTKARLEMAGDPERFAYHQAAGLPIFGVSDRPARPPTLAQAKRIVDSAAAKARAQATESLRALLGARLPDFAVLGPEKPQPALAEILKSHTRVHAAEGALYASVVAEACGELGIRVLRLSPARLPRLGKIPPPWAKDEKLAAAHAYAGLQSSRR